MRVLIKLLPIFLLLAISCNILDNNKDDRIRTGTVTDIDGNDYKTVFIGNQEWMAENLRTTRYTDSTELFSLPEVYYDPFSWDTTRQGSYLVTSNSIVSNFGRHYNWYAVNDERGLCPTGWRVPSDDDWSELEMFVMKKYNITNDRDDVNGLGNYLKSCRQDGSPLGEECDTDEAPRWITSHGAMDSGINPHYGIDALGFAALPGGYYYPTYYPSYHHPWTNRGGISGRWWSSSEYNDSEGVSRSLSYILGNLRGSTDSKMTTISVRCVRN